MCMRDRRNCIYNITCPKGIIILYIIYPTTHEYEFNLCFCKTTIAMGICMTGYLQCVPLEVNNTLLGTVVPTVMSTVP